MGRTYLASGNPCKVCGSNIKYIDNDDCKTCSPREKPPSINKSRLIRLRIEEHQHRNDNEIRQY